MAGLKMELKGFWGRQHPINAGKHEAGESNSSLLFIKVSLPAVVWHQRWLENYSKHGDADKGLTLLIYRAEPELRYVRYAKL